MITTIRKSFKSNAYKIVLWITLCAVGGVFSIVEIARNYFGTGKNWILKINNEKIFYPEFARSVADQEERLRMLKTQYGEYAELYFQLMGLKANPKDLALETLIRRTLLNQAAAKLPVSVNQEMIDEKLKDIMFIYHEISDVVPLFAWDQTLGALNTIVLSNYLRSIGLSISDLDAYVAKAIKRQALTRMVSFASYAPELELKERFIREHAPHQFSIATISAADVLNKVKNESVSDEELKNFFDMKNRQEKRYYIPEKRSASVITFQPADYGIVVTPEEIEAQYENTKTQYLEKPVQIQARRILFKVSDAAQRATVEEKAKKIHQELMQDPSRFAAVAKEISEDKESAKQGGLLPLFSKGEREQVFERAAFLLPKEGDISSLITTKEGIELVQLVSKKPQTYKPLSQVSAKIKETLFAKKFDEQFTADMRNLLQADSASIESFRKKKNGKTQLTTDLKSDNSLLARSMFKLAPHENTYFKEGQNGVLVTLTGIKESTIPEFESVKNAVKQDYIQEKAAQKTTQLLQRMKDEAGSKTLQEIKEGAVQQTSWMTKKEAQQNADLRKKSVNIDQIFQFENVGQAAVFEHDGNGYVVRLDAIKPYDETQFNEQKERIRDELDKEQNQLVTAGFIASLYRNATIVKNETQLQSAS